MQTSILVYMSGSGSKAQFGLNWHWGDPRRVEKGVHVADEGYQIHRKPYVTTANPGYTLTHPDGSTSDHRVLNEAKQAAVDHWGRQ